ncbi:MAG: DUF2249 domain-containing protein [Candidatus Dactylopiibacterium sp.]|nr:DUF2249 domain-containing protein [Candidatus Dactylopiibacterium sp.]
MTAVLDVRGLPPCEPFERILAALDALPAGQTLEALLAREPLPLFAWLGDNGFGWEGDHLRLDGQPCYRIVIRRAA